MPTCCRCKSSGQCKNCCCVKLKKKCSNCVPSRLNHCLNQQSFVSDTDSDENCANVVSNQCVIDPKESTPTTADSQNKIETLFPQNAEARRRPPPLPTFNDITNSNFTWNDKIDTKSFIKSVNEAYNEIIHWRQNLFMVPSGKEGQAFI